MIVVAKRKLATQASCAVCQAGSLENFRWESARHASHENLPAREDFRRPIRLKWGAFLRCKHCGAHWYRDGANEYVYHVPDSRIALINEWSAHRLRLSEEQRVILERIGHTPAQRPSTEFPCQVKTKSGRVHPMAVVVVRRAAPVEQSRTYFLASEIADIGPSPFALAREVREATANAEEIHNGFSPTTVILPDGRKAYLNNTHHFLNIPGIDPASVRLPERDSPEHAVELKGEWDNIVYFIADSSDPVAGP